MRGSKRGGTESRAWRDKMSLISDITGVTGLAILEAILKGERNPHTLAALRDRRIKASEDTVAKSLVGD